jgi:hypothetical protein
MEEPKECWISRRPQWVKNGANQGLERNEAGIDSGMNKPSLPPACHLCPPITYYWRCSFSFAYSRVLGPNMPTIRIDRAETRKVFTRLLQPIQRHSSRASGWPIVRYAPDIAGPSHPPLDEAQVNVSMSILRRLTLRRRSTSGATVARCADAGSTRHSCTKR